MVTTKLNLSMTEPQVRQIYAKQGDTGRVLDITLDQTPEDGTLRILRPDGTEVTSEAVTGGEVESGSTFESLTEADVTELTVGIEPVQDLSHGDPSPTNICPITGHDEVTVTRTGKNFLENLGSSATTNGITYTVNSDGSFTVKGTATARANLFLRTVSNPQRLPQGDYILSQGNVFGAGEAFLELAIRRANGTKQYVNLNGRDNFAFALNEGDYIYQPYFSVYSGTTIDATIYPMVRLASEADSSFEPYRTNTYTASLGQTVYGGTLDLVSGVLTVDKAMVDMGSLTWSKGTYFSSSGIASAVKKPSSNSVAVDAICEWYPIVARNSVVDGQFSVQTDGSIVGLDSRYTDANSYKTAVNGVRFVYPLATPLTYTLTAQQIKTLVGTNNVWASSGDIVNITFTYGGLLSELPSEATEIVGKCYCDIEQNGVSSMPFTLNVKKNERES